MNINFRFSYVLVIAALLIVSCESDQDAVGTAGQGGSLTRFSIKNQFLYVVDESKIQVFNIAANQFSPVNEVVVSEGMETIFIRNDYMYLGSREAMYIYSISDPAKPKFVFRYSHIVSCDPVVVQGNFAYVTMKSGNTCNRGQNALEIIDITDPYRPVLVKNYPMRSPGGLAIDGGCLFICEGDNGVSILDVTNPLSISLTKKIDVKAYDVIARQGVFTLTGDDGVFQYAYDCAKKNFEMMSKIPVQRDVIKVVKYNGQ